MRALMVGAALAGLLMLPAQSLALEEALPVGTSTTEFSTGPYWPPPGGVYVQLYRAHFLSADYYRNNEVHTLPGFEYGAGGVECHFDGLQSSCVTAIPWDAPPIARIRADSTRLLITFDGWPQYPPGYMIDGELVEGPVIDYSSYFRFTVSAGENAAFQLLGLDPGDYPGLVPEPAAWALMLGGFSLLGAALRSRSARRQA